jgi:hypothetical protein
MESVTIRLLVIYAVALGIDYLWGMAQMPLYEELRFDDIRTYLICLRTSFGDANITMRAVWLGPVISGAAVRIRELAFLAVPETKAASAGPIRTLSRSASSHRSASRFSVSPNGPKHSCSD